LIIKRPRIETLSKANQAVFDDAQQYFQRKYVRMLAKRNEEEIEEPL